MHIAREVADDLAIDAVDREQAGRPPLDEVARLRESGLLTLLAKTEHGGRGAGWRTAYAVVRTIAAADAAIGQLLGCHYFLSFTARFFATPALAARVEREAVAGRWFFGGGIASDDTPPTLTTGGASSAGHLLTGRQSSVTGAFVADRLVVRAARSGGGEPLAVLVDPAQAGVVYGDGEGGGFGQRLAGGGSAEFDAVPVAADAVFGSLSADEGVLSPFAGLAAPAARLVSVQLCLGLAEGLLAEVREFSRAAGSAWPPPAAQPWPGGRAQDPYVVSAYGELTVTARSASALADQAVRALTRGLARGEDLDDDECAEIAVLASVAEAAAARAAEEITSRALEVVGPRAAPLRHGFDRFWRNARAHTLREPVAHRLREVGDYFLNGAHPAFALPA
ncbi:acyl-CoA dehydrogenase family protein [Streptomyces sp. NA04227]|uniref:acyl-CoA dehydrogenase family protein n=1 Tax=Streptomyces sp. NA04227 TaxID=2742136 RepID=UPI0020CA687F|nr:acyl-CoA dehydrogenase family protein [Streptomyces sp. NA04227]